MAQKSQQVFSRALIGEPTDHQRKFVYLPLHVFRDFTNVRSLIIENYKEKKGKHPLEFVIKRTIEKYHKQLSELNKWDELGFDKLDFIWPDSKRVDARIWSLPKKEQTQIHKKATDYEKQFLYLPFHVFKNATTLSTLVAPKPAGPDVNCDDIDSICNYSHKKLTKVGQWYSELKNLEFVETITISSSDDEKTDSGTTPKRAENVLQTPRTMRKRKRKINYAEPSSSFDDGSPRNKLRRRIPRRTRTAIKQEQKIDSDVDQPANTFDQNVTETLQHQQDESVPKRQVYVLGMSVRENTSVQGNESTSCTPSDFQLEIQSLSFADFVAKTNISKLIQAEYCEEEKDANAIIPHNKLQEKLIYYYVFRMRTSEWHHKIMKNINFIECECKRKSRNGKQKLDDKSENTDTDTNSKPSKILSNRAEPTEFQKEVMAMDFETFVNETNVKDLVIMEFNKQFKGKRIMTQSDIQFGLKHFDNIRTKVDKWGKTLQYLKYKKCECQRKRKFADKWTQTDAADVKHADSQCSLMDFKVNDELKEPEQCEEIHNIKRSKTDTLTVHEITDNQIIHIQSILLTPESCVNHQIDADVLMDEVLDLMTSQIHDHSLNEEALKVLNQITSGLESEMSTTMIQAQPTTSMAPIIDIQNDGSLTINTLETQAEPEPETEPVSVTQQEETNLNQTEQDSMSDTLVDNEKTLTPEANQHDESEKETCSALLPFSNAEKQCDSVLGADGSQPNTVEDQQNTVEEQQNLAEEQLNTVEQQQKSAEEQQNTDEDQQNLAEEQLNADEELQNTVQAENSLENHETSPHDSGPVQEEDMVLPSKTDNSLPNSFDPNQNSTMILTTVNETETNAQTFHSHVKQHENTPPEASVEMISTFEYIGESESNQTEEMPSENTVEMELPPNKESSEISAGQENMENETFDSFRISQFSPVQNSTPIFTSANEPKAISQENHPNASENMPKPQILNEQFDKNSNEIENRPKAQESSQNAPTQSMDRSGLANMLSTAWNNQRSNVNRDIAGGFARLMATYIRLPNRK